MAGMQDMMNGGKNAINKQVPPTSLIAETPEMRKRRRKMPGDIMTANGTTSLLDKVSGPDAVKKAGSRGIDIFGG